MTNTTANELKTMCENIREELKRLYEADFTEAEIEEMQESGEPTSLYDYFSDILDYEFTINADKKLPTLYVAEIIATAKEACAAGTMFAPNVTAPGFLIANPIPTNTAPKQITQKFVDKPTQAVPTAITKIDAPIVNLLNVLTTVPRRSPTTTSNISCNIIITPCLYFTQLFYYIQD